MSLWQRQFKAAYVAPKAVLGSSPAANGDQRRSRFVFDPTTGALIVSPDLDLKIRKALRRAARHIAFKLFLRYLRLQVEYFGLKARRALLQVFREVRSKF